MMKKAPSFIGFIFFVLEASFSNFGNNAVVHYIVRLKVASSSGDKNKNATCSSSKIPHKSPYHWTTWLSRLNDIRQAYPCHVGYMGNSIGKKNRGSWGCRTRLLNLQERIIFPLQNNIWFGRDMSPENRTSNYHAYRTFLILSWVLLYLPTDMVRWAQKSSILRWKWCI